MRISDWSSDVCSSDLALLPFRKDGQTDESLAEDDWRVDDAPRVVQALKEIPRRCQNPPAGSESPTGCASRQPDHHRRKGARRSGAPCPPATIRTAHRRRSEEHTSELQSLMRISYAVFCLKNKRPKIN